MTDVKKRFTFASTEDASRMALRAAELGIDWVRDQNILNTTGSPGGTRKFRAECAAEKGYAVIGTFDVKGVR